jgi:hypothetical protein
MKKIFGSGIYILVFENFYQQKSCSYCKQIYSITTGEIYHKMKLFPKFFNTTFPFAIFPNTLYWKAIFSATLEIVFLLLH